MQLYTLSCLWAVPLTPLLSSSFCSSPSISLSSFPVASRNEAGSSRYHWMRNLLSLGSARHSSEVMIFVLDFLQVFSFSFPSYCPHKHHKLYRGQPWWQLLCTTLTRTTLALIGTRGYCWVVLNLTIVTNCIPLIPLGYSVFQTLPSLCPPPLSPPTSYQTEGSGARLGRSISLSLMASVSTTLIDLIWYSPSLHTSCIDSPSPKSPVRWHHQGSALGTMAYRWPCRRDQRHWSGFLRQDSCQHIR